MKWAYELCSSIVVRNKRDNGPDVCRTRPDSREHLEDAVIYHSVMVWGAEDVTACQADVFHTIKGETNKKQVIKQ